MQNSIKLVTLATALVPAASSLAQGMPTQTAHAATHDEVVKMNADAQKVVDDFTQNGGVKACA